MITQLDVSTLAVVTCYKCAVRFGMPDGMQRRCQELGGDFWCPNGHQQHYTTSDLKRTQDELARQKHRTEQAKEAAAANRRWAEREQRSAAAQKGQATRIRNRVKHGVCPCCHRTFAQLAAHMKSKHPTFATAEAE